MNIGIVVHSHTGHTRLAAAKLQEALASAGHLVSIHSVSALNDAGNKGDVPACFCGAAEGHNCLGGVTLAHLVRVTGPA
ncbi:MAG: hypothetical protein AB9880_11950 [Christensenellales bacterium]